MLLLGGLLLFAGIFPAQAQVTGISYTLSPVGSRVYWEDDAGLEDAYLYGGELGFGFGEYLELGGVYLFNSEVETDFSDFSGANRAVLDRIAALPSRTVDLRRYGGKLRLNIGRGSLVPFVTAGTGILRFDVDGTGEHEQIYVIGGAGVTFSAGSRYTVSLAAENLAYRYNPATVFFTDADLREIGLSRAAFNEQQVANWAATASLKFYLGGRSRAELTDIDRALQRQFTGGDFGLAVEPFYGQINFADELHEAFGADQTVAGVNAGVDLGPYLGLRGFYWRGTEDADALDTDLPEGFEDLTLYGAELDLRFGRQLAGGSIAPYLILGGGYADLDGDFEEESEGSRYFATGGLGVEVPLSSALAVRGAARSVLMSTEDPEDLSQPSSVLANWMYTVGVTFNLGGSGRTVGDVVEQQQRETRTQQAAMEQELARLQARLDSLETARPISDSLAVTRTTRTVRGDTLVVQDGAQMERSNLSGRTITLPVPETGEIYLRFGEPAATPTAEPVYGLPVVVDGRPAYPYARPDTMAYEPGAVGLPAAEVRRLAREAAREEVRAQRGVSESELENVESRMERRLDRELARLRNDLRELQERERVVERRALQDPAADTVATRRTAAGSWVASFRQREFAGALPFVGFRLGEGDDQFLIGGRADFRLPGRRVRFWPEAALGIGNSVSLNAIANLAVPVDAGLAVQPYVGAGVGVVTDGGIFSGPDLVLNALGGVSYTFAGGGSAFAEFSTLDFFDFNRVLVGYRLQF